MPDLRALTRAMERLRLTLDRERLGERTQRTAASIARLQEAVREIQAVLPLSRRDRKLFASAFAKTRDASARIRDGLATLAPGVAVPTDLPLRRWGDQITRGLDRLRAVAQGGSRVQNQVRGILTRLETGHGALGRLLSDPALVDEIHAIYKIFRYTPWRALGNPATRAAAPGRGPVRRTGAGSKNHAASAASSSLRNE